MIFENKLIILYIIIKTYINIIIKKIKIILIKNLNLILLNNCFLNLFILKNGFLINKI